MERIVGNTIGWTKELHDGVLADYDAWGAAEGKCFLSAIADKWGIHHRDVRVLAVSNGRGMFPRGNQPNIHWRLAQVYWNQGYEAYKLAVNGKMKELGKSPVYKE